MRSEKGVRFATCQCPKHAGKYGQLAESRYDGNGKVIAVTCARCTLPFVIVCRACDQGTTDIDEHVKASPACGDDVAYRTTRARTGSMRATKKAPASQGALFAPDVLKGRRSGAFHK